MLLVRHLFVVAALAAFVLITAGAGGGSSVAQAASSANAETFAKEVQGSLDQAREALEKVLSVEGTRTIENTLEPYDMLLLHLDAAANMPGLLERVHPDPAVRKVAEQYTQEVDKFATELSLNRDVFEALQALQVDPSDKVTHHYVKNSIRDYKRAGVDKDEATRRRIQELNEELTLIGQEFGRNIQSDTRTIYVKQEDLVGLPDDYIRSHPVGEGGRVTITTDYPDYIPFMSYSKSERARKELYKEFRNRAVPANLDVLDRLLAKRYELARLLGYENWADYITGDKMIGSEKAAQEFITRIARISEPRAKADYATLLEYKRQDDPQATEVGDWEKSYYEEIVKSKEYQFDSQSVRPYYAYDRVKHGIMGLTAQMFGVEYRQVEDAAVWSDEVETYDVWQDGTKLGRFHLDMHPRDDKYKHAAQFTIVNGVKGKQLPAAALICNFPGGEEGDPGLMEHNDVETFLHEFGHLLHTIFAGKQPWMGVAGISTEWDFVEAPSQMLEEWARNVSVLQTFAVHYETGEPIPAELVARLKRAEEFGKGAAVRQQMYYAMLSLTLYNQNPQGLDTTKLSRELQNKYSMYKFVDGTAFQCSFGHLDGYSAIYYTYMWSLVIAKDLFSKFPKDNMLDPQVPGQYRSKVLAAGGSAPAADLVEDFLGRPYNFESYEAWLNSD